MKGVYKTDGRIIQYILDKGTRVPIDRYIRDPEFKRRISL